MVSITGLEFSYTQAPNKMKSAVMALWLFTVSMGNLFTAAVNFFIRNADGTVKMSDQQYLPLFRRAHVRRGGDLRRLRNVLSWENLPAIAGTDPGRTGHRADARRRHAHLIVRNLKAPCLTLRALRGHALAAPTPVILNRRSAEKDLAVAIDVPLLTGSAACNCEVPRPSPRLGMT